MPDKKISDFGYNFQVKLITSLMTKRNFVGQVYDILKPEYFENSSIRYIIKLSLEYFKEYNELPTFETFKVKVNKLDDELEKTQIISVLKDVNKKIKSTDLKFIQDETLHYCKKQEMKNAIYKSVDLIKKGQDEQILKVIKDAMLAGRKNELGQDYVANLEKRYSEDARDPIPTPWNILTDIMNGGLSYGELGFLIAPTGAGKSWFLAHMGAHAISQGKTVVHYTLELDDSYTEIRYDTILTGINIEKIHNHLDTVGKRIEGLEKRLWVRKFPAYSTSLIKIRADLDMMKMHGINIDMVIIDSLNLVSLKPYGRGEQHELFGTLFTDARGLADEYEIPLWTVDQTNRSGESSDYVRGDNIAGSYAKIWPADFVMSLSRRAKDKQANTARAHIIKNRTGPDGMELPAIVNPKIGKFELYPPQSKKGKETSEKMQTDEHHKKKMLREKLDRLGF